MKKELNGKLDASPASCPLKKCHLLNWMLVLGSNCPIFFTYCFFKIIFCKGFKGGCWISFSFFGFVWLHWSFLRLAFPSNIYYIKWKFAGMLTGGDARRLKSNTCSF